MEKNVGGGYVVETIFLLLVHGSFTEIEITSLAMNLDAKRTRRVFLLFTAADNGGKYNLGTLIYFIQPSISLGKSVKCQTENQSREEERIHMTFAYD
jgi:hypothetical protein